MGNEPTLYVRTIISKLRIIKILKQDGQYDIPKQALSPSVALIFWTCFIKKL